MRKLQWFNWQNIGWAHLLKPNYEMQEREEKAKPFFKCNFFSNTLTNSILFFHTIH